MVKNLWKSSRAGRDTAEATPPVDTSYESVGTTLRKQREERGEDLRYVAQILRIRYPYLKAIEDGRPDELPGPTYAVGFVRTYADHLGLNCDTLVQQFKEEAAGLQARADLHFPAPLPEGKIPSGAVLVIAVVLAAMVYGAWIYLSSRDQQVAEIVPQLPNRISEIIKGNPGTATPAGTSERSIPPATAAKKAPPVAAPPVATPSARASAAKPPAEAVQPAKPEVEKPTVEMKAATSPVESATGSTEETRPAASATAPTVTTTGTAATVEPSTAEPSSVAAVPASASDVPQPPAASAGPTVSEVATTPFAVTLPQERLESGEERAEETLALSEAERTPPKIYGEQNSDSRIMIRAEADSWVEVRDSATGELLLTRVLFKGDRYQVPDRSGLTLLTGNAGGLRISVDGTDVPVLGPLGAVRRNVPLEPTPLLAGNAARPADGGSIRTDSQTSENGLQSR